MKASKKTWCLILAVCLCFGMLSACSQPAGQEQTAAAQTEADAAQTTAAPESEPAAAAETQAETEAPAGSEAAEEPAALAGGGIVVPGDYEATLQGPMSFS